MQLLVSVRGPEEVPAALDGGADIVDAKEPRFGALEPVPTEVLRAIDDRVPVEIPLSVALGDAFSAEAIARSITALPLRRRAALYVKVGFGRFQAEGEVEPLMRAARGAAAVHPASPGLIVVVYADADPEGALGQRLRLAAARTGALGVLVDTSVKDGRTLLDAWPEPILQHWIRELRRDGLLSALAGTLGPVELARIHPLDPDVVGVRGAACADGRSGTLDAERVGSLSRACRPTPASPLANGNAPARRSAALPSPN